MAITAIVTLFMARTAAKPLIPGDGRGRIKMDSWMDGNKISLSQLTCKHVSTASFKMTLVVGSNDPVSKRLVAIIGNTRTPGL